jgi:hypothetical protein
MTNEEKAVQKILDVISDIRLDPDYIAFYLKQTIGPARGRLDEILRAAGYVMPGETESEPDSEAEGLSENSEEEEDHSEEEEPAWIRIIDDISAGKQINDHSMAALLMDLCRIYITTEGSYGEDEALAGRVVWHFEDGHLFWFGAWEENLYLAHLEKELDIDGIDDILDDEVLTQDDFAWSEDTNGWEYVGELWAWDMVDILAKHFGPAKMYLPWGRVLESQLAVEDDFEEFLSITGLDGDPDDEEDRVLLERSKKVYNFLQQLYNDDLKLNYLNVPFELLDGCDLMPDYSAVGRFNKFLGELDDEHNWIIIYDECCGTCSSSSVEFAKKEKGKEDSPVFITWAQNAESAWREDGSIEHMHYADESDIPVIEEVAEKYGLSVRKDEPTDTGMRFIFIS